MVEMSNNSGPNTVSGSYGARSGSGTVTVTTAGSRFTTTAPMSAPSIRANSYQNEEEDSAVRRGREEYDADSEVIFAMDEEVKPEHHPTQDPVEESELDLTDDDFDGEGDESAIALFSASSRFPASGVRHSGRFAAARPNTSARLPSSSIAASLPVTISKGFWPLREAIEGEGGSPNEGKEREGKEGDKTILSKRDDDIYRNIQAYSRSIQPADDPERLFGERPRRRYRTGRDSSCACETPSTKELMFSPPSPPSRHEATPKAGRDTYPTMAAAVPMGIVRSVVGSGFLSMGASIPIVVRDLNASSESGREASDAICEEVIVGSMAGESGRPRIIIPASLPLYSGRGQL